MPHRIIRRSHIFCRSRDESFSVIEKINAASGTFCGIKTDNGKFYIINLKFATMGQIKTPNHVIFEWEKKSESNGLESLLSDHKLWLWWNWKYVGLYKTISPHPLLFIGTIKILKSFFPAFIPVVDWWGEMQPPGLAVNNIKRFWRKCLKYYSLLNWRGTNAELPHIHLQFQSYKMFFLILKKKKIHVFLRFRLNMHKM